MEYDFDESESRWNRFDKLFDLPEIERKKSYTQENLIFLEEFVSLEMNNYTLPEIENEADFSEIIEVLRINYRQWNQRLCGLLISCSELRDLGSKRELAEFIEICPWKMLTDVARNTPE